MIYVPSGTFTMGANSNELGSYDWERPRHSVTLTKGFWMGKFEITQAQWMAITGENPARFKSINRPVEQISWNQAVEFCKKLTEHERAAGHLDAQHSFTLPTEAQWEYACRAGTTSALNNGKELTNPQELCPNLSEIAWYKANTLTTSDDENSAVTLPVGLKAPNLWGFHDMLGNVWEWTSENCSWDSATSSILPDTYKDGITDPSNQTGPYRILRGGSYCDEPYFCRSAFRLVVGSNTGLENRGLRVVINEN